MTVIAGFAPVQLLLVEDSPGDVRLTLEAFRYSNTAVKLHVATDGAEAVQAFRSELPDLTILDLNLPVKDGEQAARAGRIIFE